MGICSYICLSVFGGLEAVHSDAYPENKRTFIAHSHSLTLTCTGEEKYTISTVLPKIKQFNMRVFKYKNPY
jgi:hypothetical protein